MYERFTDRAREVMKLANKEAARFNHDYFATEHILLGLMREGSGVAAIVLKKYGIDFRKLRSEVEKFVQFGPEIVTMGKLPITPRAKKAIEYAIEEARNLDHNYVSTEHLLLGLLREQEGVAVQVLMNLGLEPGEIRGEILRILGREILVEKKIFVPPVPKAVQPSAEAGSGIAMENSAMYERFTDRARKVLQLANQEAQRLNHEYIGTEHVLLGLIKEGSGVAANVLKNLEIDLRKLRTEIEKIVQSGPDRVTMGRLPQTPMLKKVIELSVEEARNFNHKYVGTEHLLAGLLRTEDSVAAQVLLNLGLKLEDVREETLFLLGIKQGTEGWEKRRQQRAKDRLCEEIVQEENHTNPSKDGSVSSADIERIRSLEQQLWNVRILLGAVVGTIAGALLFAQIGSVMGLLLGGLVAALGRRSLGVLAGGGVGAFLGCTHLGNDGGRLAGALLGAVAGFLIADVGSRSNKTS
jgi:ATP-dependent Clp protease ATP-binding subunit ClpA